MPMTFTAAPQRGELPAGRLFHTGDFVAAGLDAAAIWERIVTAAVRNRGSDIHLSFHDDLLIAVRLDGRLLPQGHLPLELGQRLLNHAKVSARLDPAEKRRPQDGHIRVTIDERPIDLRLSLFPTNHGESAALRIQDRATSLLALEELGLSERQYGALAALVEAPSGLVLVTGPTGTGKTTTLYAILRRLADGSRKIVTIEDPIEYDLPGVEQSEVHLKIGLDPATLMRAALRHDPNVIMIGEVRDAETADAVVRAANSGRLVFATTHAVNSAAAVESLVALGAHPHFVARAFRGAIAQTLVRRLCRYCTVPLAETAETGILDDVRHLLGPHERPVLSLGRGCPDCRHTGYQGRTGLFEILVASDEVREQIAHGVPAREIRALARQARMISMDEAGKLAALRGLTTVEELVQNVSELWTGDK